LESKIIDIKAFLETGGIIMNKLERGQIQPKEVRVGGNL